MMKGTKQGWAGPGAGRDQGRSRPVAKQEQGRSISRAGAGQEQGRIRAEQSRAGQGRKTAGAGHVLGRSCEFAG